MDGGLVRASPHVLLLHVQLRNQAGEPSFIFAPVFFLDTAFVHHPEHLTGEDHLPGCDRTTL
jgi:hypothetical protein